MDQGKLLLIYILRESPIGTQECYSTGSLFVWSGVFLSSYLNRLLAENELLTWSLYVSNRLFMYFRSRKCNSSVGLFRNGDPLILYTSKFIFLPETSRYITLAKKNIYTAIQDCRVSLEISPSPSPI